VPSMFTCSAEKAADTWSAWAVACVAACRIAQPDSTGPADQVVLPSYDAVAAVAAAVVVDAVCRTHIRIQGGVLGCSYQDR